MKTWRMVAERWQEKGEVVFEPGSGVTLLLPQSEEDTLQIDVIRHLLASLINRVMFPDEPYSGVAALLEYEGAGLFRFLPSCDDGDEQDVLHVGVWATYDALAEYLRPEHLFDVFWSKGGIPMGDSTEVLCDELSEATERANRRAG